MLTCKEILLIKLNNHKQLLNSNLNLNLSNKPNLVNKGNKNNKNKLRSYMLISMDNK